MNNVLEAGHCIVTNSEKDTIKAGRDIIKQAMGESNKEDSLIFYLEGDLGSGKTQLAKGIAEFLGVGVIASPTFVLVKKYNITGEKKYFFHIDCYRIVGANEAEQIGIDKILQTSMSVVVIEWAERIKDIIPLPYWHVKIDYLSVAKRSITYVKKIDDV
jgi:tRNA threonylcarbamoyladenosine biosynthesis protein TsaE